jgi:hypothetical protein
MIDHTVSLERTGPETGRAIKITFLDWISLSTVRWWYQVYILSQTVDGM